MSSKRCRIAVAALAVVALPLAGSATAEDSGPVRVLVDRAGDANGLTAVPDAPTTAPASLDDADLVHVDLARVGDALQLRIGLTALPNVDGDALQTFYRLSATLDGCRFHLGAVIGTLTPTTPAPGLVPFFDPVSGCPGGDGIIQAEEAWTGALDAGRREIVLTFPIDSLVEHIPGIAPGARLTGLSGDTSVGTYAFTRGLADLERYTTVVLDAAPGGLDYVVPCTAQEC
jgi:hypothetical protein